MLVIKASISSSIIGGYAGTIVRGASEASGALGTSEGPLVRQDWGGGELDASESSYC